MRHDPIDERMLEAMECCRPASDDLGDPAMSVLAAELGRNRKLQILFTRMQKVDAVLAGAIQDVLVPVGLAERLLAGLGEPAAKPALAASAACRAAATSTKFSRRRGQRWALAISIAAAAILLVTVGWFQRSRVEYSPSSVLEAAVDFFNRDGHDQGNLLSAAATPWGYPASRYVRLTPETRWRKVGTLLKSGGVAYELGGATGPRATLYVIRQSVPGLPDQPPPRPVYGTARCSSAAWQEGQLLYVLVVVGEAADYQRLVNVSTGPVA